MGIGITKVGIANTLAHIPHAMVTSKPYQKIFQSKIKRSTFNDIVAGLTIGSIVLKDGIGCIMYVEQSKHNKKIPEERRDFVWKLDAVNGGLMIAFQLLFFLATRKFTNKMFEKLIPAFKKNNILNTGEIIRAEARKAGKVVKTKAEQREEFINAKTASLDIFKTITELVASTILAKRVVVPLIATYITNKLETKHGAKTDKKQTQAQQPADSQAVKNAAYTGSKLDVTSTADNGESNLIKIYKNNNNLN